MPVTPLRATLLALAVASACADSEPPLVPGGPATVTGDSAPLLVGATRRFTASGATSFIVNGVVGGSPASGTIDGSGLYTAPLTVPVPNPVVISVASPASDGSNIIRVPITPAPVEGEWYSYEPRVTSAARVEPVLLTVHAPVGTTRIAMVFKDGTATDFTHLAGRLHQVAIPAAKALAGRTAGEYRNHVGFIDFYAGETRSLRLNSFVNVTDAAVPPAAITVLAPDAQKAAHVLNLVWGSHVNGTSSSAIARRAYALLPDAYDFMAMVWPINMTQNRYWSFVRNDTRGIGVGSIDNGATFGSAARLQGTLQFPIDGMFDLGAPVASHEIGHRWINFLQNPALRPGGAHWPLGDVAYGIMGFSIAGSGAGGTFSYRLDSIAPGEYRLASQPAAREFNMVELYLMGLASPEEVPPFFVFADQNQMSQFRDGGIMRGGIHRLTVDSIVAVNGPRVPSVATSPKEFRLATVVVSLGRRLSNEEMAFFELMAARGEATTPLWFRDGFVADTSYPFHVATRRRARLVTRL